MMKEFRRITGAAVLAAAMVWGFAHAQDSGDNGPPPPPPTGPQSGDHVTFCGKVVALVQDGCIGIVALHNTYDLTSITPKPPVGTIINGSGIIGMEATRCGQGIHMRSATWSQTQYCSPEGAGQ